MKTSVGALFKKLAEQKKAISDSRPTPNESSENSKSVANYSHNQPELESSSDYHVNDVGNHQSPDRIPILEFHPKKGTPAAPKILLRGSNASNSKPSSSPLPKNLNDQNPTIQNPTKTFPNLKTSTEQTVNNPIFSQKLQQGESKESNLWAALRKATLKAPIPQQAPTIAPQEQNLTSGPNLLNNGQTLAQKLANFANKSANNNNSSPSTNPTPIPIKTPQSSSNLASTNEVSQKPTLQQLFKKIISNNLSSSTIVQKDQQQQPNDNTQPDKQLLQKFANAFTAKKTDKPNSTTIFCLASSFITNLKFKTKNEKNERKEYLLSRFPQIF